MMSKTLRRCSLIGCVAVYRCRKGPSNRDAGTFVVQADSWFVRNPQVICMAHALMVISCYARSFIPTFCDDIMPYKYAWCQVSDLTER